jgi:hypothetical protein
MDIAFTGSSAQSRQINLLPYHLLKFKRELDLNRP